jgi:hypothetical protein
MSLQSLAASDHWQSQLPSQPYSQLNSFSINSLRQLNNGFLTFIFLAAFLARHSFLSFRTGGHSTILLIKQQITASAGVAVPATSAMQRMPRNRFLMTLSCEGGTGLRYVSSGQVTTQRHAMGPREAAAPMRFVWLVFGENTRRGPCIVCIDWFTRPT